jgi:hypothetical protein
MGGGEQGFCDNSTKVTIIKSVTMLGGGVQTMSINCVTSYMDDSLVWSKDFVFLT